MFGFRGTFYVYAESTTYEYEPCVSLRGKIANLRDDDDEKFSVKTVEMVMAMATPIQCRGSNIGYAYNAIISVHSSMQPPPTFSWAAFQPPPVTRTREISHSLVLSNTCFFEARLPLNWHKPRPRPRIVGRSSKISPPDPDFAKKEALKFKEGLLKKLAEDQKFANQEASEQVAETCTKIFQQFLMNYTGALLVAPFADMKAALDEEGLPGSSKAARHALVWAQDHLEDDWKEWSSSTEN